MLDAVRHRLVPTRERRSLTRIMSCAEFTDVRTLSPRPRILFFAEAVTLAHVARPFALMQTLDPCEYEACLACDPRYDWLLNETPHARRPIHSISTDRFLSAVDKGAPFTDA